MKPQNWDTFDGTGFFVMCVIPRVAFPNRIGGVIKLEQGLWIAFLWRAVRRLSAKGNA